MKPASLAGTNDTRRGLPARRKRCMRAMRPPRQREFRSRSSGGVGLPRHKLKILKAPVVIVRRPLHAEDALRDLKFGVETRFRQLEFIRSHTCLIKIDL